MSDKTKQNDVVNTASKNMDEVVAQAKAEIAQMINEAQATAKAIIDEAQAKAQEIAENANNLDATPEEELSETEIRHARIREINEKMKQKTTHTLFEDGERYTGDKVVMINGKYNYIVQRGQEVEIPQMVKDVLVKGADQEAIAGKYQKGKEAEFEKKMAQLNI